MLAFHNDPAIKEKYLARVKAHALADEIVKGKYWEGGRGCAVGCTIHSGCHFAYETELGIPEVIAHLEDCIFESLPNYLAMTWPVRFLEAVNVGADLKNVWPKFAVWLLIDEKWGVSRFNDCHTIKDIAALMIRKIAGDIPTQAEWAATAAAWDAAGAAAWDAARATRAATAATRATRAAGAAWDAAGAAAWDAAWATRAATRAATWAARAATRAAGAAAWDAARATRAEWDARAATRAAGAAGAAQAAAQSEKLLEIIRGELPSA